jgi:hypothetical protein
MKRLVFILLGTIVVISSCKKGNDTVVDNTAPADGWYTPLQYQAILGVGIDVDWAKTPSGIALYNEKAVIDFKAKGISHVRIRVANDISADLLNHIDKIVKDCFQHNLIPVVAYQADAFKNYPTDNTILDAAIAWWGAVADRLKNYPSKLSFDLLIECTDELNNNNAKLNEYMEKATARVRQTNPKRIVFISPRKLASPLYLNELAIPTQGNGYIMAETHFYAAGPSKTNPTKLWTTGTADEKKLITDLIDAAYTWQVSKNIPVWIGAWMPADYDGTDNTGYTSSYDIPEQVVFATFMSCQLKKKKIPYAVNSDTKFYDRSTNKWHIATAPVVDAFLTPTCP